MADLLTPLLTLLNNAILPNLETIQKSQAEQHQQSERLQRAIDDLRSSITLQLIEIRTSLAEYNARLEELLTAIHDGNAAGSDAEGLRRALSARTRFN